MIENILYNLSVALGYKENRPAYETFPKQKVTSTIGTIEIHDILAKDANVEMLTKFNNADMNYLLVDIFTLAEFLKKNNIPKYDYVKEIRDCDDFSFMLQGDVTKWDPNLAFGIAWGVHPNGHGHAFNWCIGTDRKIWLIEPQSNYVFQPKKLWKITTLIM